MPRYVVPHHGGLKYVRAIPKDVLALEGRKVWTAYLKGLSVADAKTRALELAAEHDKRAKVLRNLAEPDKRLLKSKGGLARCQVDLRRPTISPPCCGATASASRRPTRRIGPSLRSWTHMPQHTTSSLSSMARRAPTPFCSIW